jgi:hypothetical protein
MWQSSSVHVPVKACGKKRSTTFFPFREDKVNSFLSDVNSVKSGAFCPIAMLIFTKQISAMMVLIQPFKTKIRYRKKAKT